MEYLPSFGSRLLLFWVVQVAIGVSAHGQSASGVRGQVTDRATGFGIEGVVVGFDVSPADGTAEAAAESDLFGFFQANVAEGSYRIRASHPGFASFETNVVVAASLVLSLPIVLTPVGSDRFDVVIGVVCVTSGVELGGVPVQIERFNTAAENVPAEVLRTVTDVNGEAAFRGIASGWYGFRVNDAGFAPPRPKWDPLLAGLASQPHSFLDKDHHANVRLKPQKQSLTVQVLGFDTVRYLDQQPLEQMTVEVTGVDPLDPSRVVMPTQTSVTDENGRAVFTGLPAIAYRVVAKRVGYTPAETVVHPDATGALPPASLNAVLKPTNLFVVLGHPYTHSNFVAGLRVELEGIAGTLTEGIKRAQTLYDGRFPRQRAFFSLLPGKYRVSVNGTTVSGPPNNMLPRFFANEQVDVIEGVWTDLNLPLAVIPATVRGQLHVADEMAEERTTEGLIVYGESPVYRGGAKIPIEIIEYEGDGYLVANRRTNLVTTDDLGEFSVELLPGRYGVRIASMTNHWGHSIRLRNLTTTANSERDVFRGWPYPDVWPFPSAPPPSNSTGEFGNPVFIRSGHQYQMELFVHRQIVSMIGQVEQVLGNNKDSVLAGSATLHSDVAEPIQQPLVDSGTGRPLHHFKHLPPGTYSVTFSAPHYTVTYDGNGTSTRTITVPQRPAPGVLPTVDPLSDFDSVPFTRFDLGTITATYIPPSTAIRVISHRFQGGGYSSGIESTAALVRALPDGWNAYEGSLRNLPYGSFDYWISFQGNAFVPEFTIKGRISEGETKTHEIYWRGGPTDTPVSEYQQPAAPVLPVRWVIQAVNLLNVGEVLSNITTTATLDMINSNVVRTFQGEHIEPAWEALPQLRSASNPHWVVSAIETRQVKRQPPEYLTLIKMNRGTAVRGVVSMNTVPSVPLEGIRVRGLNRYGGRMAEATTDAAGAFAFAQELNAAPIYLEVDTPGYIPWRRRFTSADAVARANGDSDLIVEIPLDPLPGPSIASTLFDRFGVFFPGLNRVGNPASYSGSLATKPLTLTSTMTAEQAPPIAHLLTAFDTRLGGPGAPLPPLIDPIAELWMIDPRSFTNRARQGTPTALVLPTEPRAWATWLQRIANGSISNVYYQRSLTHRYPTNTVGMTNFTPIWQLPEGLFDPVFVAVSRHGGITVQTNYPFASDAHRLRGVRMPPWLSFSSDVFASVAAFLDNPQRASEVTPQGRFVPRGAFEAAITNNAAGFLDYRYTLGVDWNEGIQSPGSGFLQFLPSFLGAKMQSALQFGLRGTNAEVYVVTEAKDTLLDLESTFDNAPLPVTPIFKPSIDTTLRGSRQFAPVSDPYELEITDEVGIGFEVGATFEIEIKKVPLIGRVLRKLKIGGAAATGRVAAELDSRRSWGTRFPEPRPPADSTDPGLDQVFRRHFAGGRKEIAHLWDLCLFSQASLTLELPLGAAAAEGGVRLVGEPCVHGRPTAKLTINPQSDWPYVTDISGSVSCFLEPKVSLWFKEVGYFITWPFFDFSYPYSTDPVFQLIPVDTQRRLVSPSTASPGVFSGSGTARVSNFYPAGTFAAASSSTGQLLAYSDVEPATGQMLLKVVRRSASGLWETPVTVATAAGIVNVGLTHLATGKWVAVWTRIDAADAQNPFPPSTLMFSHSADGVSWNPPALLASLSGVAAELRLVASGDRVALAFAETDQGPTARDYAIKTALWDGAAWTAPAVVRSQLPLQGFDLEGVPGASSPAFLLTWLADGGTLNALAGPAFDPSSIEVVATNASLVFDVTGDPNGGAFAAWRNDRLQMELARRDGTNWMHMGPILPDIAPSEVRLLQEGKGADARLLMAWSAGSPAGISIARFDASGGIVQPVTLLSGDATQGHRDLELSAAPEGGVRLFARRQGARGMTPVARMGQPDESGVSLVELSVLAGIGPRLLSPRLTADGGIEFFLQGDVTRRFRVQSSTDLRSWTDLKTDVVPDDTTPIRDALGDAPGRYYRAVAP
jgi:hypothetical protein